MPCCSRLTGDALAGVEPCLALTRSLENLPGIGHLIAAAMACCCRDKSRAEKAALKATVGLLCGPCNCMAEAGDEISRRRSEKMFSFPLEPRPDWMRQFRMLPLTRLCLPGTHQSGTALIDGRLTAVPLVEGWARCQSLPISAQLRGGVRFLDLRVFSESSGELWLHHNVVRCVRLRDVLTDVRRFVRENPSEIVELYMTNDGKPLDWGRVHSLVSELLGHSLIPEHMKHLKIGDLTESGKNVIIYNVPDVAYSWRCLRGLWPNKAWPEELAAHLQQTLDELGSARSDYELLWYKAECTPNSAMIVRHLGGLPGLCAKRCAREKFLFIEDLAAAVNTVVHNTLQGTASLPFHVLCTDYIHDDVISRIIDINARLDRQSVVPNAAEPPAAMMEETPLLPNQVEDINQDVVTDQRQINQQRSVRGPSPQLQLTTPKSSVSELRPTSLERRRLEVWETST